MRLSVTLSFYIARQFCLGILFTLLALMGVGLLIDIIELIRRASAKEAVPFGAIIEMALLKVPYQGQQFLPFAVMIGSMLALTKLTRSQELVIARSVGVSVWQFLLPAVASVALIGILAITVFNPLSAVMLMRFEHVEGKYITGRPSMLSVSSSGLWLRQVEQDNPGVSEYIIYALRMSPKDITLEGVSIYEFNRKGAFSERFDAKKAVLGQGVFTLSDVIVSQPGKAPRHEDTIRLPTALQLEHIQDSFASPETMPFWSLPSFIDTLENAGFSALRHRLYWQSLLASPLLLVGMVMVAAVFSLRLPRRGKLGMMVTAGAATGFGLFFFNDLVQTLGAAGTLPVVVAAWTPALIVLIASAATLLHLEDG